MPGRTIGLCFVFASGLLIAACGQDANHPTLIATPTAPSAVGASGATSTARVEVPFHSDVVWQKTEGTQVGLCTVPPPPGKMYLMRNTITATAVSTHLGTGDYLGHTCVYGTPAGPEGWFSDVRWTAANGDVLLATGAFREWTGVPGRSVAIEDVTFQDGGTGRFQFAQGQAVCHVNAPGRTAVYEGSLRYGKMEK